MDPSRIAELLKSYIVRLDLPAAIYAQLAQYLELLLRWNAKTNLTAIREPEQIVTRHFGESLFAAAVLFGAEPPKPGTTLADFGSGAGFPGVPIKLAFPKLRVTLIESQNKKATFLKEVIRAIRLEGSEVYSGRAEQWGKTVDIVTMRAAERFEAALQVAASLTSPRGKLCLLVGKQQSGKAHDIVSDLSWSVGDMIPNSSNTMIVVGNNPE